MSLRESPFRWISLPLLAGLVTSCMAAPGPDEATTSSAASLEASVETPESIPCLDDSDCAPNGTCDPTQGWICVFPPCTSYLGMCGGGIAEMEAMMCKQQMPSRIVRVGDWCYFIGP